ncbi:MAG: hypothetical protein JSS30_07700 [Verrucomicrobia bacterium]|nr:hypothetical protein [Verrucomicrobiota bacterium]
MQVAALKPINFLTPEFGIEHSAPKKDKDVLDVISDYAGDRWASFTKALYVLGVDVPKEAGLIPEEYEETADEVRHYLNLGKLLESPGKWLKNLNTWRNRTVRILEEGLSWDGVYQWIRGANGMINPTYDSIDFLTKSSIVHIAKPTLNTLKGINGIGMIVHFGSSVIDSVIKFNNNEDLVEATGRKYELAKEDAIVNLLQLVYEVSLLALGVLTVLTVFFAAVVPSVVFVTCSASSVVSHISRYFYENIGPGMKKNEPKGKV